jgi:hypothetical protein
MTEKKRPRTTAIKRAAAPVAKPPESPAAPPSPPSVSDADSSRARRLRELGEALEQTVDEVRRTKLDRDKLLAIASAIAGIARILGEPGPPSSG